MTTHNSGTWLVAGSAIAIVLFFALADPIPQDPAYHEFVDDRHILGIPNFWNVMTNLPFLFVGAYGLLLITRNPAVAGDPALRIPWMAFFTGLTLTSFGSAYYHLVPANGPLVWDRLPMTLGFAGFFAVLIGEYVSVGAARRLFVVLAIAGAASAAYWYVSESNGNGDLRPYAVVVIFPLILTPIILMIHRHESDLTPSMWMMIAFYAVAKLFEHFDGAVATALVGMSGHPLKHVFAALAPVPLIHALHQRQTGRKEVVHA